MTIEVHFKRTMPTNGGRNIGRWFVSSAEDRFDSRQQLSRTEGLTQIVVCAELEAQYAVEFRISAGEKNNRKVALRAYPSANVDAVALWHQNIENHEIGSACFEL